MAIRLRARQGKLPVAFRDTAKHLTGRKSPFRDDQDKALAGAKLTGALAAEGIGAKRITFTGKLARYNDAEDAPLHRWRVTVEVPGTLDPQSLARLAYAAARQQQEGAKKGNTPKEIYLTGIQIRPIGAKPRKAKPAPITAKVAAQAVKRTPPKVRYRDRTTGRLVKEATWNRSRAAKRRAGGGAGRYVRETF